MYEIVKAIVVPDSGPFFKEKYPFKKMEVGDSFLVTSEEGFNASHAAYMCAKRYGTKFSIRKLQNNGGTRIWRVS